MTTVDPEMATPGPMYVSLSGADLDVNPDDGAAAAALASADAAGRKPWAQAGCTAAAATATQNARTTDHRARKRMWEILTRRAKGSQTAATTVKGSPRPGPL